MPKEFTHFTLAGQVINSLPKTSKFLAPIQKFPLVFLLGAVCPDSPFYYLSRPQKKEIQALANPFHQPGKEALVPVLKFLKHHHSPQALAFAAGTACHIMSDTAFHPLVYYYAGMKRLHPGAQTRHKYFETALDIHVRYLFGYKTRLYKIIRQAKISKPELYQLLAGMYLPQSQNTGLAKNIVKWHVMIHFLLGAYIIRKATIMMACTSHSVPESVASLIYPFGKPCILPFFSGQLRYRHPCSGEFISTDLLTLIRQAVDSTVTVLQIIDRAMVECKENGRSKQLELRVLADTDLPDISPDLPADTFDTWYGQQDIKSLLYQEVDMPF